MRVFTLPLTLSLGLAQGTAWAQSESSSIVRQDDRNIVVTARRRADSERAQDVPMAVTALDPAQLARTGADEITDIGPLVPNVQTSTVGTTPGLLNFSIRGIGVNGSIRIVDSPVTVIQDGMVITYPAGAVASLADLESVEVLRGPQGTLFGRNATGGAIILRTRRPQREPQIRFEVDHGSFSRTTVTTDAEGRLGSEAILGRLAVSYTRGSGSTLNGNEGQFRPTPANPSGNAITHPDEQIGRARELTIKPTLLILAGESTEVTLLGQLQRFDDDASTPRNFMPPNPVPLPLQTLYGFTPTARGYRTNVATPGHLRLRSGHAIGEVINRLGSAKLTTTIAYRQIHYDSTVNFAGSPFLLSIFPDNRERNEQFSLETRLNIPFGHPDLEFLAGFFFLTANTHVVENRLQGPTNVAGLGRNTYTRGEFDHRARAAAAYGNVEWQITPELRLAAGGRLSLERKRYSGSPLVVCPAQTFEACGGRDVTIEKEWHDFSPRVVLDWRVKPSILFYASYARGFRSGNFNNRVSREESLVPADPEHVDSFELGARTELLDHRGHLNVALFDARYEDIQQILLLNTPGSAPTQTLFNAANARILGAEIEAEFRPLPFFSIEANVGYTHAAFTRFNAPVSGVADPTLLRFARIPEWTLLLAMDVRLPFESTQGVLHARASYDWRSSFPTDFQNTPELIQEAYGLINASLTFERRNWSLGLFGRNLGNVEYAESKGRNVAYVAWGGEPRTYGIRLTAVFR